jgi:hypothetical protein
VSCPLVFGSNGFCSARHHQQEISNESLTFLPHQGEVCGITSLKKACKVCLPSVCPACPGHAHCAPFAQFAGLVVKLTLAALFPENLLLANSVSPKFCWKSKNDENLGNNFVDLSSSSSFALQFFLK